MISSHREYAGFVYALQQQHPNIRQSTLVLANIGPKLGRLQGQLHFDRGIVLDVWELIDFDAGRILNYSYEIYQTGEKICWYDPFEHPHIPELASTHPHHKHILPDIKHHRVPAPGITFDESNLLFLIQEVERSLLA